MKKQIQSLGPGLLFAGAAIGVSHLVQSTRAGAQFGYGLLWALIIVNVFKYPFFQFGARYANATGESLLEGYAKLHKGTLVTYFILNLASMFSIQSAITLVTAGLAMNIFGYSGNLIYVSVIITIICFILLIIGRYQLLDKLMKIVIITLSITTLIALAIGSFNNTTTISFIQKIDFSPTELGFLIAFLGWMPAPLDVSIWQSIWSEEKQKNSDTTRNLRTTLFDFNTGYITTLVLGICFLSMGAIVMYNSGTSFASTALGFSKQLIEMYTTNIGSYSFIFIAIAAFTTMFSTTLTALDASPRGMEKTIHILSGKSKRATYIIWLSILAIGTVIILFFFKSQMFLLIKIATILSFLTAPFFAILNHILINSKYTPTSHKPEKWLNTLSILGILFLIGFSIWYLTTL